jgi:hypothetical protein
MKKVIAIVALVTAMGTANAGFFGNNYGGYNGNGFFGFNPYSFMGPRWFIQEASNFVDEFDGNNYGYNRYHTYGYNHVNRTTSQYMNNYMDGYSRYVR